MKTIGYFSDLSVEFVADPTTGICTRWDIDGNVIETWALAATHDVLSPEVWSEPVYADPTYIEGVLDPETGILSMGEMTPGELLEPSVMTDPGGAFVETWTGVVFNASGDVIRALTESEKQMLTPAPEPTPSAYDVGISTAATAIEASASALQAAGQALDASPTGVTVPSLKTSIDTITSNAAGDLMLAANQLIEAAAALRAVTNQGV